MFSVPTKKSLPVLFSKPFATYIQTAFQQDPTQYSNVLKELDDLRNEIINLSPSLESCARLARYLGQLNRLESRFPLGEDGIKITFSWFNFAGKEKKPIASHSIKYEQACVLFNIGASYTQLATMESLGTTDGLKRAYNYFLFAAGVFEAIQGQYLSGLQIPSGSDISEGVLSSLVQIMHAQAQECFVLKAQLDKNVKDTIMAKLSFSTSNLYESVSSHVNSSGNSSFFTSHSEEFYAKKSLYLAMAHYKKSSEFLIALQYGKEIVKLQEANENIKDTKDYIKRIPPELVSQINALGVSITKNLERATKDNTIIYNDPIPSRGSWGDCGVAVIIKSIAFPDPSLKNELDATFMFERLPCISTNKHVNALMSRRDVLIAEQATKLTSVITTLDTAFADLGLPGAIEAITQTHGVPDSLKSKSQEILSEGGFEALERGREANSSFRSECLQMINDCKSKLDEEESQDNQARQKFGVTYSMIPSHQLNASLRKQTIDLQNSLNQASLAETGLDSLYELHIPCIISLCSSPEELERSIPLSTAQIGASLDVKVLNQITDLIPFRDELKSRQGLILKGMQQAVESYDLIGRVFDLEQNSEMLDIISNEIMSVLEPVSTQIDNLKDEIDTYISTMRELVTNFKNNPKIPTAQEREDMLQKLDQAYQAYKTLSSQVQTGLQFYNGMKNNLIGLTQAVMGFVEIRKSERQNLINLLQMQSPHQKPMQSPPNTNYYGYQQQQQQQSPPAMYPSSPQPGIWNPSMPQRYANGTPDIPQVVLPSGYYNNPQSTPVPAPGSAYPTFSHQPQQQQQQQQPGLPPQPGSYYPPPYYGGGGYNFR